MNRPGFSFLVCPDAELIKDRIAELLRQDLNFASKIFWGDEELSAHYWQALTARALMGPQHAVVLRRAHEQKEEFWVQIEAILARPRKSAWPIFCLEGEWKTGKPAVSKIITKGRYWSLALERGWMWEYPGVSRANIGIELDRFSRAHGLSFAPGVKKKLAESLPLTTIALRNELEKILLLAGEATLIRPAHLDALIQDSPFNIFAFLRNLQNPATRPAVWARVFHDPAMSSGDTVFPLLALLIREARQLWQLAHGEAEKVSLPPSLKAEKIRIAQRLGPKRLSQFWDIAIRAETDIKTGRLKSAQAMETVLREVQHLW